MTNLSIACVAALSCGLLAAAMAPQDQAEPTRPKLQRADQVATDAQDQAPTREDGELYFIVIEHVKPSMTAQYEQATKDLIGALESYQADPEKVGFRTIMGAELGYTFVIPLAEGFGSMQTVRSNWMEVMGRIGEERMEDIFSRSDAAVDRTERFHVTLRDDLSYAPDNPAVSREDAQVLVYHFYYVIPGMTEDFETCAHAYIDAFEQAGINTGWRCYEAITGSDLPLFAIVQDATSVAGYHARAEKMRARLGDQAMELHDRVLKCTRRMEELTGTIRPDLSYPQN